MGYKWVASTVRVIILIVIYLPIFLPLAQVGVVLVGGDGGNIVLAMPLVRNMFVCRIVGIRPSTWPHRRARPCR